MYTTLNTQGVVTCETVRKLFGSDFPCNAFFFAFLLNNYDIIVKRNLFNCSYDLINVDGGNMLCIERLTY